jgi:hypothetical protein
MRPKLKNPYGNKNGTRSLPPIPAQNFDAALEWVGRLLDKRAYTTEAPKREKPSPHCDCKEACEEYLGRSMHVFQGSSSDVAYYMVPTETKNYDKSKCLHCGYEVVMTTTAKDLIEMLKKKAKYSARANNKRKKRVVARNVLTGQEQVFDSVAEAEKGSGIRSVKVGLRTQKPIKNWLFTYEKVNKLEGAASQSKEK